MKLIALQIRIHTHCDFVQSKSTDVLGSGEIGVTPVLLGGGGGGAK